MNEKLIVGLGWERDLPDFRDYNPRTKEVDSILKKSNSLKSAAKIEAAVDLTKWCSPIEDQGKLGSCTANAGVGLLEYYERRAYGRYLDGSRLFLYKVTRNLLGKKGDTGAHLRTTMKAIALFGVPPEKYWPYNISEFDNEPSTFCYAFAGNFKAIQYYRLDPVGNSTKESLDRIKTNLAAGLPSMFGFSVFSSIPKVGENTGDIPFPDSNDSLIGGHAVVAVGYDDKKKIRKSKGALMIRNSWGTQWGENGYGWLPYDYVESGLAVDFWSLVQADFVDTDLFK
jgi:C1A family cysteine protease